MFRDFLLLLRKRGLKVSLGEWMTLLEGLEKGLHHSSFHGFYFLSRAVLVKSEADFDLFDRCFLEYFQDVPFEEEISQDLMDWLDKPESLGNRFDKMQAEINANLSEDEINQMLEERLKEQKERHDGGKYWIGTGGMSVFGNSGFSPNGIRVGGESQHKSAFRVAGERKYQDFRGDVTLDSRQFQVALRQLRQFSGILDLPETEFDVDKTVKSTCDSGGRLSIQYKRPRQNTVKLLLCIDCGGSMDYYSHLCTMLFQAVSKTSHFKDIQTFYFHNVPYGELYRTPTLEYDSRVGTGWVLENLSPDYKVLFVGDAQMAPYELTGRQYGETESGLAWLQAFQARYPHIVWLNPSGRAGWGRNYTYDVIEGLFPMFPLTVDGLEASMKTLLVRQ